MFFAAVAQLDRVLGYEPRGRGFDSCQPHQYYEGLQEKSCNPFLVYVPVFHLPAKQRRTFPSPAFHFIKAAPNKKTGDLHHRFSAPPSWHFLSVDISAAADKYPGRPCRSAGAKRAARPATSYLVPHWDPSRVRDSAIVHLAPGRAAVHTVKEAARDGRRRGRQAYGRNVQRRSSLPTATINKH